MRVLSFACIIFILIAACSSVDESLPTTPNTKIYAESEINGIAAIGTVVSGSVTAYDFSSCTQGAVLATTTLDGSNQFHLTIQPTSQQSPVMLEFSDMMYIEEASGVEVYAAWETLKNAFILEAGAIHNATISFWTNLAHARTEYLCGISPANVSQHIQESNNTFSNALTFNIITQIPEQIQRDEILLIDVPAVKYGAANAAVSFFTYNLDLMEGAGSYHTLYSSMTFAEIAYADLASDKMLNGVSDVGELLLGAIKLNVDSYRTDLPNNIYYVLATRQFTPASQKDQIEIVAKSINQSTAFDMFDETEVIPVGEMDFSPAVSGVSYTSCNTCFTNVGTDRLELCNIVVEFDIDDPNANVTVDAIFKDADGTITPNVTVINPYDNNNASFSFSFDPEIIDAGSFLANALRTVSVTATNDFGLTTNFDIAINARVPSAGGWYGHICSVDLL